MNVWFYGEPNGMINEISSANFPQIIRFVWKTIIHEAITTKLIKLPIAENIVSKINIENCKSKNLAVVNFFTFSNVLLLFIFWFGECFTEEPNKVDQPDKWQKCKSDCNVKFEISHQ